MTLQPPEPSGAGDTRLFLAQNPHYIEQADQVWELLLRVLVGEMNRVHQLAVEQGAPSPVPVGLLTWLNGARDGGPTYRERFEHLVRATMSSVAALNGFMSSELGNRQARRSAKAQMANLRMTTTDLHRLFDLRAYGEESVYYTVTHPRQYSPADIGNMVCANFGRLATKFGVDDFDDDTLLALGAGVREIVADPDHQ